MIVFKGTVAILDVIFFSIFLAFIFTLEKEEVKSNPITAAFFILATLLFATNAALIFTM